MDKEMLIKLIALLEKSEEGGNRLDSKIFEILGYRKIMMGHIKGGLIDSIWVRGDEALMGNPPLYTISIDSARSLIESGYLFSLEGNAYDYQSGKYGIANIWCAPEYSGIESMKNTKITARGNTPALALCIAALKVKLMSL